METIAITPVEVSAINAARTALQAIERRNNGNSIHGLAALSAEGLTKLMIHAKVYGGVELTDAEIHNLTPAEHSVAVDADSTYEPSPEGLVRGVAFGDDHPCNRCGYPAGSHSEEGACPDDGDDGRRIVLVHLNVELPRSDDRTADQVGDAIGAAVATGYFIAPDGSTASWSENVVELTLAEELA